MSEFGDAAAVTPEINYTLMSSGDLGESLVQAAAGYESVADMLMAELTAMGLNTSTTAAVGWLGPGGVMMQMTAVEFMAVCAAASEWVRVGQIQAAEVAASHAASVAAMIPAEVCLTNRATQAGLVGSNFFGQNTPGIVALDAEYFGHFWVTNASARTGYGSVVSSALGALSPPAPLSPTAANPAGPFAAVAGEAAAAGGEGALQTSARTMTQVAEMPAREAAGPGEGMMSSLAGQAGGIFGQAGSALGQVTSTGQQLPSMLGQAPQAFSGILGPLGSMSSLGGAGGLSQAAGPAGTAMPLGGAGALSSAAGIGGGGGGGLMGSGSALSSTFVRPANSFSTPTAPTLPGGWQGGAEAGSGSQARPAGMGGGGLYGAPPAAGREGSGGESSERATRTMRVTARGDANRGESQRS
jgi:PPE-repeat protein